MRRNKHRHTAKLVAFAVLTATTTTNVGCIGAILGLIGGIISAVGTGISAAGKQVTKAEGKVAGGLSGRSKASSRDPRAPRTITDGAGNKTTLTPYRDPKTGGVQQIASIGNGYIGKEEEPLPTKDVPATKEEPSFTSPPLPTIGEIRQRVSGGVHQASPRPVSGLLEAIRKAPLPGTSVDGEIVDDTDTVQNSSGLVEFQKPPTV